jgi:hypothetical protein
VIHEGDLLGIASSNPSSISIDLTYDRRRFDNSIRKMSGGALSLSLILDVTQGPAGPEEVRYRAILATSTAYDIMRSLEHVGSRRKAFIYVSTGYNFEPSPEGSRAAARTSPFLRQGNDVSAARVRDQLAELPRQASRANVTIFAIDPSGLAGVPRMDPSVDRAALQIYQTTTRNSLRVMSEQTGGFALVDEQNPVVALQRIGNAMRE